MLKKHGQELMYEMFDRMGWKGVCSDPFKGLFLDTGQ